MTYSEIYTCDFCGESNDEPGFNAWLKLEPMAIYHYNAKLEKRKTPPFKGERHFCSVDHLVYWIDREFENPGSGVTEIPAPQ